MTRTVLTGLVAAAVTLALAAPVLADEEADAAADDAIFDRAPEHCVSTNRIRETEILDDQTILFFLRGGTIYRNMLDRECHGLAVNDRFAYTVRSSRLCENEIITVLEYFGAQLQPGMRCTLGAFHPVTPEEAELMLLDPDEFTAVQNNVTMTPVEPRPVEAEAGADAGDSALAGETSGSEAP